MLRSRKWLSWILPGLVLIVGIGLSLALQIYSRDGVFFSSDAGLKALLAQQFSLGKLQTSLDIPQPGWVLSLWRQGLYPFAPPYVYEQQGNYFITFPFVFPALTAPFYKIMGYRGLYAVPLVSLWIIWLRLWQVCRVWQVHSAITALSMGVVILASPLTLYGAMYWEHTLAVALAFWGLSGLLFHVLPEGQTDRISLNEALVNGVCIGLAVWFRPEFLCLVVSLGAIVITGGLSRLPAWAHRIVPRGVTPGLVIAFTGAMALTVLGLLGVNGVMYGRFLGMYAIQGSPSIGARGLQIWHNYSHMAISLLRYFPAIVLGVGLPWLMQGRARSAGMVLMAIGGLFAIAVPLIAPSGTEDIQWGPRLYLILVPMTGLMIAAGLQHLWQFRKKRQLTLATIALVMVLGLHINLIKGGLHDYRDPQTNSVSLPSNHAPVAPAIAALAHYNERWVAIPQQQIAHQLWPHLQFKTFFRTETDDAIKQLALELINQGESSFLYVCTPEFPCPIPNGGTLTSKQLNDDAVSISFRALGTFGKYPFYRGLIKSN